MMKNTFYLQRLIQKTTLLLSFLCLSVQNFQSLEESPSPEIKSFSKAKIVTPESSGTKPTKSPKNNNDDPFGDSDDEVPTNNTNNENNNDDLFGNSDGDPTELGETKPLSKKLKNNNNKEGEEFRDLLNELGVNGENNKKDDGVQVTEINLLDSHVLDHDEQDKLYSSDPNVSPNLSGTNPPNSGNFTFGHVDFSKLKHGDLAGKSVTMDSFGLNTNDEDDSTFEVSNLKGTFGDINIPSGDDFEQTCTVRLTFVNQGKLTGKKDQSITITKETTLGDLIKKYATFLRSKDENLKATIVTSGTEPSSGGGLDLDPESLKHYCLCLDDKVVPLRKLGELLPRYLYYNKDVVNLIITKLTDVEKLNRKLTLTIQNQDSPNLGEETEFNYKLSWSPSYFSYKVRQKNSFSTVSFFKGDNPFKISNNSLLIDYESFRKGQPITAKEFKFKRKLIDNPVIAYANMSLLKNGKQVVLGGDMLITEKTTLKYLIDHYVGNLIKEDGDLENDDDMDLEVGVLKSKYCLMFEDTQVLLTDETLDQTLIHAGFILRRKVLNNIMIVPINAVKSQGKKLTVVNLDVDKLGRMDIKPWYSASYFIDKVLENKVSFEHMHILDSEDQLIFEQGSDLFVDTDAFKEGDTIRIKRKTTIDEENLFDEDEAPKLSLLLLKGGHLVDVGNNAVEITKDITIESFIKIHKDLLMKKGVDLSDKNNKGELDKGALKGYALILNDTGIELNNENLGKTFGACEIDLNPGQDYQIGMFAKDDVMIFRKKPLTFIVTGPKNIIDENSKIVKPIETTETSATEDEIAVSVEYVPCSTAAYLMGRMLKKDINSNAYKFIDSNGDDIFSAPNTFLIGIKKDNFKLKIVQKTSSTRNENVDNNEVKNNDREEKNDDDQQDQTKPTQEDLDFVFTIKQAVQQLQLYQENNDSSLSETKECLVLIESNLQGFGGLSDKGTKLFAKRVRLQVANDTTIEDIVEALSEKLIFIEGISSERHSLMINDTDLLEEEDDEQTLLDLGINPDEGICLALINKAQKDHKKITIYKTSIVSSKIALKKSMRMDSTTEHEVYPWYSVRHLCKKLSLNPRKSKLTFKDKEEDLLTSLLSTPLIDCGISKKNNELQYTLLDEPKEAPMSKPKSKETTVSVTLNLYQRKNQIKTYQLNIPKDQELYQFIDDIKLELALQWTLMLGPKDLMRGLDKFKTLEQLGIKNGSELNLTLVDATKLPAKSFEWNELLKKKKNLIEKVQERLEKEKIENQKKEEEEKIKKAKERQKAKEINEEKKKKEQVLQKINEENFLKLKGDQRSKLLLGQLGKIKDELCKLHVRSELDKNLESINERIDKIEGKIKNPFKLIKDDIRRNREASGLSRTDISKNTNNLKATQKTVTDHTTQIRDFGTDLTTQTRRIDGLGGDLNAERGRIDNLNNDINTLNGLTIGNRLTTLETTQANKANSSVQTDVDDLGKQLKNIRNSVKDIEGDSNFMAYTGIALLSVTVSLILSKVLFDSKNPQEEDLPQKENQEEPSETTIEEDREQLMQEEGEEQYQQQEEDGEQVA